ncbi:MAG: hypothetical protein ABMB14_18290 [Myxococcota bacterium]
MSSTSHMGWSSLVFLALGGCGLGAGSARAGEAGDHTIEAVRSDAMSRYHAEDYSVFVNLMEAVVANGDDATDDYNLACGYALNHQPEQAIAVLSALAEHGDAGDFRSDEDFDSLRDRPDFRALVARVEAYDEAERRIAPYREVAMEQYAAGQYAVFVQMMEPIAKYSHDDRDRYNLACGYALIGRRDDALAQLAVLAEHGSGYDPAGDEDFVALRTDPRFHALADRMARSRS